MNRFSRMRSLRAALVALALGAFLTLLAPTAAMAQHGGGRGYSGGRSYSGSYSARSFGGRTFAYRAPSSGRYFGGGYYRGGGYYPGRFYAGRGYYYGGRFWARPYFGIGIGIPFGWGYNMGYGCGYYDGYGNWLPAPCYSAYPAY